MEIQVLKLLITEQDLNEAVTSRVMLDPEVRQLRVRVAPEGVYVAGVYRMLVSVAFETLWELTVAGGKQLQARLSGFKALGLPVMLFKSMVMTAIRDAVGEEDALQIEEDTVQLDVERLLAREKVTVRTNLHAVRCAAGHLIIESLAVHR